jgi:thioredoxin-related protein
MKIIYVLLFVLILLINKCDAKPPIFLDNFNDAKVVSKDLKQPIILLLSADWCQYCNKLKKEITNNLDKFNDTTICIVDIEKYPDIAKEFKARKIPKTIVFDSKGNKLKEIKGYTDIENLLVK